MHKIMKFVLLGVVFCFLTGCFANSNRVKQADGVGLYNNDLYRFESIDFTVYEANASTNHQWVKARETFTIQTYNLESDMYTGITFKEHEDVGSLDMKFTEIFYSKKQGIQTESTLLKQFTFPIGKRSANGVTWGFAQYPLKKNVEEEQLWELVAINRENDVGHLHEKVSLDQPYDEENENQTNFLITVKLNPRPKN